MGLLKQVHGNVVAIKNSSNAKRNAKGLKGVKEQ